MTRHNLNTDLKNLIVRTITGGIFVGAIVASAILSPLAFSILFFMITLAGIYEFIRLTGGNDQRSLMVQALAAGGMIYADVALVAMSYLPLEALWGIVPLALIPPLAMILYYKGLVIRRMAVFSGSLLFVVFPMSLLNLLLDPWLIPEYHNPWFLLGMFAILWTHDTFAYLCGSMFGRHPLWKSISPKKSIEGSIGGFGFAVVAAYIISIFSADLPVWVWIAIAFVVAFFGTAGDLAESVLKRRAGVKDSGNLLPGHGGILDRFDSLLLVSPLVFIFVLLFHS